MLILLAHDHTLNSKVSRTVDLNLGFESSEVLLKIPMPHPQRFRSVWGLAIKMFLKFLGFKGEGHCSRKTGIMHPNKVKKE